MTLNNFFYDLKTDKQENLHRISFIIDSGDLSEKLIPFIFYL